MKRLKLIGLICWGIILIKSVIKKEYDLGILASIWIMYLAQH